MSVLTQDYPKIEYIVLDDGSTDATLETIKKCGDKIIWDSHPNMGETKTVNKGFSMAKGEIICVVNSDDPLLPGAISKIVSFMMSNPRVGVVYPDWIMIDENGKKIRQVMTHDYDYISMIRLNLCMPGPGTFFRREVVEKLGGRDVRFRYVGDFDFWLRAGLLCNFARIREPLATFRIHADSATVCRTGAEMGHEYIELMDKYYSLPNLPLSVKQAKREAYGNAYYAAGMMCGENRYQKKYYYQKALLKAFDIFLLKHRGRFVAMGLFILFRTDAASAFLFSSRTKAMRRFQQFRQSLKSLA